ncbi:hypothetical protein RXV86_18055 [Alisedimentitalea sp. MJ-SS2]|uniref:hypothetical protein n=1 Tax=Aliisedimentitalea sp. MJ-SS2 TaxID=3049795 RepID=UPI0029136391|nr:hypothetical protein [Alisedimentitalea sp. MJ-SS2]MDU8929300.1 hypothetical protein [Alisedimentitalea sp. MJ-SS2]
MPVTVGIAYVVFMLVGPVIFIGLIRHRPTRQRFVMGVFSALALIASAQVMRATLGHLPVAAFGWLAAMWLGWIVTLAMVVQAVTLKLGRGRPRKWGATLGAAATVLPWFGLSLAMSAG